jgi:hypothetical protein
MCILACRLYRMHCAYHGGSRAREEKRLGVAFIQLALCSNDLALRSIDLAQRSIDLASRAIDLARIADSLPSLSDCHYLPGPPACRTAIGRQMAPSEVKPHCHTGQIQIILIRV